MNPVLFALVDAVLAESAADAQTAVRLALGVGNPGLARTRRAYWHVLRLHLGWWRSTWAG